MCIATLSASVFTGISIPYCSLKSSASLLAFFTSCWASGRSPAQVMPICDPMENSRLFEDFDIIFDMTSFSTPNTTPSTHLIPIAVLVVSLFSFRSLYRTNALFSTALLA